MGTVQSAMAIENRLPTAMLACAIASVVFAALGMSILAGGAAGQAVAYGGVCVGGSVFFLVITICLYARYQKEFSPECRWEQAVAARDRLDDDAFDRIALQQLSLPHNENGVPSRVRRIFANHLGYDATQLRCEDHVPESMLELDFSALVDELEQTFSVSLPTLQSAHPSLADVVVWVAEEVSRAGTLYEDKGDATH